MTALHVIALIVTVFIISTMAALIVAHWMAYSPRVIAELHKVNHRG